MLSRIALITIIISILGIVNIRKESFFFCFICLIIVAAMQIIAWTRSIINQNLLEKAIFSLSVDSSKREECPRWNVRIAINVIENNKW